jgi:hypothetical protein
MHADDRFGRAAARYGVPAVILAAYLAAVRFIGFTPDVTFGYAHALPDYWLVPAAGADPFSPIWALGLGMLAAAGLDAVLAAKVLSLLLASAALLMQFLVTYELVRDRLASLGICVAAGGLLWFAPAAAGGTPHALALVAVLTALFFQLRNAYPLSGFFYGIAALVAVETWPAVLLLAVDARLNSIDGRRGFHVAAGAVVVWVAVVTPWVGLALWRGVSPFVPLPPWSPEIAAGPLVGVLTGLLALIAVGGLLELARGGGTGRKAALMFAPALALALVLLATAGMSPAVVLPAVFLLLAFSALGVRVAMERRGRGAIVPLAVAVLAAVTLLVHQVDVQRRIVPAVVRMESMQGDLESIALWLRAGGGGTRSVEAERHRFLEYASGRRVHPPGTGDGQTLVVTAAGVVPGCTLMYRPPVVRAADGGLRASSLAVWGRR